MEHAAIICRVSTREQEDGYSLDAQERLLREYCEKFSYLVALVYRFSETASKHDQRKQFRLFMGEVTRKGIKHIAVEKVDRLTRGGLKEAVMIDDWLEEDANRQLHCVKDSIDLHKYSKSGDKLNWGMRVVLAKNYADNLREEVMKATDVMLRRGIWPTKPPIGYIRDKSFADCPIRNDPAKGPLVRKMYELYDTGEWSVERLSFKLEELGLRNSNDHRIMPSRIHVLLRDSFYIGKMEYRDKVWDGMHEPLISVELFERVQRRLKRAQRGEGPGVILYRKHDHIFAGKVFCSNCGKPVSWELHRGFKYGCCKQYRLCTHRNSIPEAKLEDELISYLGTLVVKSPRLAEWIRQALKASSNDERANRFALCGETERQLKLVSQKLERLLDMRLEGDLSKEEYEERRKSLGLEKERLTERLKQIEDSQMNWLDDITTIYDLAQQAPALYAQGNIEQKRTILRQLFTDIRIDGHHVEVSFTPTFKLLHDAVVETNRSKVAEKVVSSPPIFEQDKIGSYKAKEDAQYPVHPLWLPG